MVELQCESYSLAIESRSAFYDSLGLQSNSRENRPTTAISGIGADTTLGVNGPATTAISIPQERPNWADRPTATGQTNEGKGVPTLGVAKYNALVSVTVFLAISILFGFH